MRTQLQDVTAEKAQLAELKAQYMHALCEYLAIPRDRQPARDDAALKCQRTGSAYFNHAEEFVGNSDLLGAHVNALWAQGFAEDCAEILSSLPKHFEFLRTAFGESNHLAKAEIVPASTAYANMQRMVARYLKKSAISRIKGELTSAGLPTYGFDNKAKNFMQRDKTLAFAFGICFILLVIGLALFKPDPTKFQYTVFRTVLALAGAGIGAVVPGTIQVNVSKAVRAGGAIALFVIVYFWNPAQLA